MKEYRRSKGLIQQDLSDLVGVSRRAVADWESGKFFPTDQNLKKLAQIFEVDQKTLRANLEVNFVMKQVQRTMKRHSLGQDEVLALIT